MLFFGAIVAGPLAILAWLLSNPRQNLEVLVVTEHFIVVTNVALIATVVALLVARAALSGPRSGMLLVALGFAMLAGLFAVHGLATPGMLIPGDTENYSGSVVGLSAFLSLFVPSLFFAARYSRRARDWVERHFVQFEALPAALLTLLITYAALSLSASQLVEAIPLSRPPLTYGMAGSTVVLLLFASWRQAAVYRRTLLPFQGALIASFLLLADAQVAMVLAPSWTLAWWEYHLLMLAGVVVATGALIVELDRRRGLERFLPATAVESVLSGETTWTREPRVVTVLFADLRDSTSLAQGATNEEVLKVLNDYLGAVASAVTAYGGTVDKFLGDGLMVLFGLAGEAAQGAIASANVALRVRQEVTRLNQARLVEGKRPVNMGIGIHTGSVVMGPVGLAERADFTAIGDTVNTAARLQDLCKLFSVDSVLSQDTAAWLHPDWFSIRSLGDATLRGRTTATSIWTFETMSDQPPPVLDKELLRRVPLFAGLQNQDLEALTAVALIRTYNEAGVIVREGTKGEAFFIILNGEADVIKGLQSDSSVVLQTLQPGDYFGEMAFFEDYLRSASVVARGPVNCLALTGANLMGVIRRNPELSIKLLRGLSRRLRETDERIAM